MGNGWYMQIYKGKHYRQMCKTELEAALLYDQLARELFGNKAYQNFPIPINTIGVNNLDSDQI
jgi:hypothetical protein